MLPEINTPGQLVDAIKADAIPWYDKAVVEFSADYMRRQEALYANGLYDSPAMGQLEATPWPDEQMNLRRLFNEKPELFRGEAVWEALFTKLEATAGLPDATRFSEQERMLGIFANVINNNVSGVDGKLLDRARLKTFLLKALGHMQSGQVTENIKGFYTVFCHVASDPTLIDQALARAAADFITHLPTPMPPAPEGNIFHNYGRMVEVVLPDIYKHNKTLFLQEDLSRPLQRRIVESTHFEEKRALLEVLRSVLLVALADRDLDPRTIRIEPEIVEFVEKTRQGIGVPAAAAKLDAASEMPPLPEAVVDFLAAMQSPAERDRQWGYTRPHAPKVPAPGKKER